MTYDQLLPVYRQITGLPGQDDAFNQWVQGIVNASGSQQGVEGIPDNFFSSPAGQNYVSQTATTPQLPSSPVPGTTGAGGAAPTDPSAQDGTYINRTTPGFAGLTVPRPDSGTFQQAPAPNVGGGNYNQVQNAVQGGQFGTVGATTGAQQQTTGGTTEGQVTSKPVDTLGFGQLLANQATTVGASDAARTAFLQDLMTNGGTQFQSQLDQGIRNSLTGPQMTGAGDSARARAAGYGAAEIGRKNLDARLGAARELAGPTGLSSLSTAANPYIGQQQSTSGTTTGFADLMSKSSEAQAGTTTGQSSQAGAGQIPQGQPVKTGGCVLCTAGIELGLWNAKRVLRKVIAHKLTKERERFHNASRGYFAIFTPVARWLLTHPKTAKVLAPLARAVVYEELRVSGRRLPLRRWASMVHWIGHGLCAAVGAVFPVRGYVTDPVIIDIARRNNILFEVQS